MKKTEMLLDNVRLEVALEILAMKIALIVNSDNIQELNKLLSEQEKVYNYDEKVIDKVLNVYGCEIKNLLKGEKNNDK